MDYDLKEADLLGSGAYGKVYKISSNDGVEHALKCNLLDEDETEQQYRSLRELSFMSLVKSHPSFVQLKSVLSSNFIPEFLGPKNSSEFLHFVMELGQDNLINVCKTITDINILKKILVQLLLGLEFIHHHHIGHFDLKPENVLVDDEFNAKICDFGISERWSRHHEITLGLVTSVYRAPEVALKKVQYDGKADIWSLGCIIYEIINHKSYIAKSTKSKQIFQNIINARDDLEDITIEDLNAIGCTPKFLNRWYSSVSDDVDRSPVGLIRLIPRKYHFKRFSHLKKIVGKMLMLNPHKRASATELLDDPIFKDFSDYITSVRASHLKPHQEKIKIKDTPQREELIGIYQRLYKKDSDIYHPHHIIHALSLYDKIVIKHEIPQNKFKLFAYVMLFMFHINCSNLVQYTEWSVFCNSRFSHEEFREAMMDILEWVNCKYDFFTVYEYSESHHINREDLYNTFLSIKEYKGTLDKMYSKFFV